MYAVVVTFLLITCAIGWLNQWVCNAALISWIIERGLPIPGEEMKKHLKYAWEKTLGLR